MCIRDFDKLNLFWQFDFWLEPIFAITTRLPQKNIAHFFRVYKSETKNIASFTKIESKSLKQTVKF